jgi:teichuronic acid biosynthesis glycosyltransferase TuaC
MASEKFYSEAVNTSSEFRFGLPRVLAVIPGTAEGTLFIFSKRQVFSLQQLGVPVEPFFLRSRQSPIILFKEWRRFRKKIHEFKPDLVHAHYGTMTAFFCGLATRAPLVVTYRGSDLNPTPGISLSRSVAGKLLSQIAALRASRIICVSEQLKQRLRWRKSRAIVLASGINMEEFKPRAQSEARRELGWGSDERVVLFNAGRDPKNKRLDLAQVCITKATQVCGNIRFVVLDGGAKPAAIPTLMNASDCLLVTSNWEGSPNIVKEAMACNLPVVSVDVGDVKERLAGVRPSKIVNRDIDELGNAIAEILLARERSNGRQAVQSFGIDQIGQRLILEFQFVVASAANKSPHTCGRQYVT